MRDASGIAENTRTKQHDSRCLRTDLRASVADGAAFSVMVGMGETYLPAFVLAVGLGEVIAGLAATIPMLAGAILQLASPRMIRRLGSHRRWVITCSIVQACSFIPFVIAAMAGRISWPAVLLVATVYWGSGLAAGPAWQTWMAGVVPRRLRAPFFARRTRATQAAVLLGLIGGGVILSLAASRHAPLAGFAVLFAVACLARMISAGYLIRQREPAPSVAPELRVTPIALFGRLKRADGRLLTYMLAVQTMTYLSAPYFTPFMLGQLKMSYPTYMLLLATAFVAKIVALPTVGRFAQRFNAAALLWIGGVGIIPLAGLWAVSTATSYLLALQILGGVAWACYELATFLLLFEAIRDDERTSLLTSFNAVNAMAIATGSAIGGIILRTAGETHGAYTLLFCLSSAGRLCTLALLTRVARVPRIPAWTAFRTIAVRPSDGSMDRPILMSVPQANSAKGPGGPS